MAITAQICPNHYRPIMMASCSSVVILGQSGADGDGDGSLQYNPLYLSTPSGGRHQMQQLSGMDSIFLATERLGVPQHIGGVSLYDQSTAPGGKVRFKDILNIFESRAHLSPIFRRRLVEVPLGLDQPYWVEDKEFDPEFHVRHVALPKPGDWRQLCILSARIHSRPLDLARPLWEAYVIEGLDGVAGVPSGSFALLTKVHHSAMDGVTGMQFYGALHDLTPEPREIKRPPAKLLETSPSTPELLTRAYFNNLFKTLADTQSGWRRRRFLLTSCLGQAAAELS